MTEIQATFVSSHEKLLSQLEQTRKGNLELIGSLLELKEKIESARNSTQEVDQDSILDVADSCVSISIKMINALMDQIAVLRNSYIVAVNVIRKQGEF